MLVLDGWRDARMDRRTRAEGQGTGRGRIGTESRTESYRSYSHELSSDQLHSRKPTLGLHVCGHPATPWKGGR